MRYIILSLIAIVLFAFALKPDSSTLRDEFVKYNIHDQKMLFMTLTKNEREELWEVRLRQEAKFHKGEKKKALLKLSKQMNGFSGDTKEIEENFIKLFGKEEAYRILVSFRLPNDSNVATKFLNQHASNDNSTMVLFCESCHVDGFNWCTGAESGQGIVCISGSCTPGSYFNYGCGTLFLYSCDGSCGVPPRPPSVGG